TIYYSRLTHSPLTTNHSPNSAIQSWAEFRAILGRIEPHAMRETESAKGSSFALTLAMSGETIIDFAQELRDAKAALAKWKRLRKDKCGGVVFSIVAPVGNHPEIQNILERTYREAEEPGPLLRSL